jgi:hypothetical protein
MPRSEFFKGAQSDGYGGADKPTILADESPSTFKKYTRYVYFGVTPEEPKYQNSMISRVYNKPAHFGNQIGLYLLADRLGDHKTANLMTDEIYTYSCLVEEQHEKQDVNLVYRSTEPDNLLRALLRDMMIYHGHPDDWPNESLRGYDYRFRDDLLLKFMDLRGVKEFCTEVLEKMVASCEYHIHGKHEKCAQSPSIGVEEQIETRKVTFR